MYEFDVPEQRRRRERGGGGVPGYVRALIAERRAQPRDDMVSALVEARVDGERLTDDQIVSTVIVLLNAGHEASVNTLGNGMLAFARHPEQWRRVVDGEVAPATAGEEMIRYDPPLQLFERWVLADDFAIGEQPIPRGDKIALLFGSANRDPRGFRAAGRVRRGPRATRRSTSASAAASTSASGAAGTRSSSRRASTPCAATGRTSGWAVSPDARARS
jgi:unspecific monooxygenase